MTDSGNNRKSEDVRFIERVFTPAEKDLIFSSLRSDGPDQALWSLWACKEAAFKAVSKSGAVSSSPLEYTVFLNPAGVANGKIRMFRGSVSTPAGILPLRLVRNSNYVHAVASTGADETINSVFWVVCNINLRRSEVTPHMQSMLVRRAVTMKLAKYINASPQDMEIVRRKRNGSGLGPPVLLVGGRESGIEISLSHDGLFLAYAFLLDRKIPSGRAKEFVPPPVH